jgi:hypothetical protein
MEQPTQRRGSTSDQEGNLFGVARSESAAPLKFSAIIPLKKSCHANKAGRNDKDI